eukprot:12351871-Alexandrium_andersonii.AAC.1
MGRCQPQSTTAAAALRAAPTRTHFHAPCGRRPGGRGKPRGQAGEAAAKTGGSRKAPRRPPR